MYYPLSFRLSHAFDYWPISILANSMVLCNTGPSMEKVLVPRWTRLYGLFGLPWSRKLYAPHHSFSISFSPYIAHYWWYLSNLNSGNRFASWCRSQIWGTLSDLC